jgi:hypothetical protein
MQQNPDSRIARWSMQRWVVAVAVTAAVILGAQAFLGGSLYAQKAQADFKDKLRWASETGDASVACSADGKYVYVAGGEGILVSDNFGKTGSWTLVLKGK